jgi:hypothetical protein
MRSASCFEGLPRTCGVGSHALSVELNEWVSEWVKIEMGLDLALDEWDGREWERWRSGGIYLAVADGNRKSVGVGPGRGY